MKTPNPSYVARACYLALIAGYGILGDYKSLLLHSVVFLVSLPVTWLGRKDAAYAWLDTYIVVLFMTYGPIMAYVPGAGASDGQAFGIDKLFHALGGASLGWLGYLIYRKQLSGLWLAAAALTAAITIGVGWEIFEWILSVLPHAVRIENFGLADTLMDMIADTAGACIAIALCSATDRG